MLFERYQERESFEKEKRTELLLALNADDVDTWSNGSSIEMTDPIRTS